MAKIPVAIHFFIARTSNNRIWSILHEIRIYHQERLQNRRATRVIGADIVTLYGFDMLTVVRELLMK